MKLVFSEDHRAHDGGMEMLGREMVPLTECTERMDHIMAGLKEAGFDDITAPDAHGFEVVHQVHDPGYVSFLERCYPLWEKQFGPGGFAVSSTFGMRGMDPSPNGSVQSLLARYTFDLASPFVAGTWAAVRSAKDVALTGARMLQGGERAVFSICRPPGHHASGDMAGGYCYLNNAAIAAQDHLNNGARRVAILDVDYHHGNGTQAIFYGRSDVFFASLHCRPEDEYPYLMGYAREIGEGAGQGYNLNLPMPRGTGYDVWEQALMAAIGRIQAYGPDVLVVSLGVDAFSGDPVGGFELQSPDFLDVGRKIRTLDYPTHFVMEGGYALHALGQNVANVITGFSG